MTYGDDRMNTRVDWIEIEQRVRAGESARAISRDLTSIGNKISHTAINKHCKRGGWKLPDTSAATITKRPYGDQGGVRIQTPSLEDAARVLNVGRSSVIEAKVVHNLGTPEEIEAGKTGKAAANHSSTQDLDGDTTAGATQELPTEPERTPVEPPKKKAKPQRRKLWALQRNGTTRVVGFYDKGV